MLSADVDDRSQLVFGKGNMHYFGDRAMAVELRGTRNAGPGTRNPTRLPFDLSPAARYEYEWEFSGCGLAALRAAWFAWRQL